MMSWKQLLHTQVPAPTPPTFHARVAWYSLAPRRTRWSLLSLGAIHSRVPGNTFPTGWSVHSHLPLHSWGAITTCSKWVEGGGFGDGGGGVGGKGRVWSWGRWEVQWVGGEKNKKKIKHTVTICLKWHLDIDAKVCLGATLHCMYVCM